MEKLIRVMLVEDNVEYREVIRLALEQESDIELVSQFGTSEIGLRSLQNASDSELPDLILLDLRLPGMDGLEALPQFRQSAPQAKIMILTQSNQQQDVLRAITLGASGYLLKSARLSEITEGICMVAQGGASLDKGVAMYLLESLQQKQTNRDAKNLLTDREFEILTLMADGFVKKEIAARLKIGYSTVDTHVAHIYEKLQVTNGPSAVNRAHRLGIFSQHDADIEGSKDDV
ncbi:two component transcriptional regulator, LuxR family [Rhodopirellula maiorica SM1]|uniref:Two component transcriptional regulator, LuxR family n=1 Tax=Rhodopirellula maiorica SM1 TaxID=1265738 RepID=M5RUJ7_9BACT|nr:response regulator transcription factor [Rhodopirellula maiorica]EMI22851.1 two component transcriptional regulator, LuxR family [Rhodopirellula maiorica SM1]